MRAKPQILVVSIIALFVILSIACGVAFSPPQPVPVPPTGGEQGSFGDRQDRPGADLQSQPTREPAGGEEPVTRSEVAVLEAAPPAQLSAEEQALVELYQRVNPGVVSISVQTNQGAGAGSGFIIDDQGHIVTNSHVVLGAGNVIVAFYNGIQAPARVVGTDLYSDLAVIQVESLPEGTVPLVLADSDTVQVGQQALAIGNPFGEEGSLTAGIVSYVGRTIPSLSPQFAIPLAIQTDAPINPGNSGGPLLNSAGQVIGVNSQIESQSGVNAGIGFAVPSNIVRRVVPALIQTGSYDWPWLGIEGTDVSLALAEAADLPVNQGAYIVGVLDGTPAASAGLRGAEIAVQNGLQIPVGGDIVVAADGEEIRNWDDLLEAVALRQAGETITLTILRDGRQIEVPVQLAARPRNLQPSQQGLP